MPDRRSFRVPWIWGVIFFLILASYASLVVLLVAVGCPLYLALLAPPAITASAAGATLWLRQFLTPAADPPAQLVAGGGGGHGGPH